MNDLRQQLPVESPNDIMQANLLLQSLLNLGMVETVDVVKEQLAKRETKAKEKKVLAVHPNQITETTVNKNGKPTTVYQTRLDGKRPRFNTYEALIDKLYVHYFGAEPQEDFSFRAIFELALDEKIRTEAPKEKTIRDAHSSYKAFISPEFGASDVRLITPSQVKEYIQKVTQELNPTQKRLYKFKGILNLVFNYASDMEHNIIPRSPVPTSNAAYKKNCKPTSKRPEDKAFQLDDVRMIQKHLWKRVNSRKYDLNGYAILFASETGVREGEIPSLKWNDVGDNYIHIHSQQNDEIRDGIKVYYYNPTTKDEKGVSRDGRKIPMNANVRRIFDELKKKQKTLGIKSEWVFAREDGSWTTTASYYESLYKVSKKLGLKLSNNHAFRMALNSYVFVPMGLSPADRAKILGHSVQTNLNHYTFARADEYLTEMAQIWDSYNAGSNPVPQNEDQYLNVIEFSEKKKPSRTANSQGLIKKFS